MAFGFNKNKNTTNSGNTNSASSQSKQSNWQLPKVFQGGVNSTVAQKAKGLLVSTSKSIAIGYLKNNAPNVISTYNTLNNYYKSAQNLLSGNISAVGGVSYNTDLINRMANINWARGYQWDVHLDPEPEGDFSGKAFGLPVFDIKETCAEVGDSYNLNASNTDYQFPLRKKLFDIQLTMFDNEKGEMEQYFEDWINDVYAWDEHDGYIGYLSMSVRELRITKLDSLKREIFTRTYLVYPEIQLTGVNNSDSAIRILTVPLVVAGYLGKKQTESVGGQGDLLSDLKKVYNSDIKGATFKDTLKNIPSAIQKNTNKAANYVKNNQDRIAEVAVDKLENKAKKYLKKAETKILKKL